MDRIDHLIATFREAHPEVNADVLAEFAQHVRRVVADDIRAEMRDGQAQVKLSVSLRGQAFSATGPRDYVEGLLENFQNSVNAEPQHRVTPGFNRMKLIGGQRNR
jgi:hypothetical protein